MTDEPKISVLMGTYNCEDTLGEAIESIFAQSYANWELILCDDGSTDETYTTAEKYVKQRPAQCVLLRNETNKKLSYTLNRCLHAASGELIARMDADDISHPDRFEKQVRFLQEHPDIQLVGTAMRVFDESGYHGVRHPPALPDSTDLISGTPFFHATILAYKHVYDALHGYSLEKRADRVEDIDLWFRFFAHHFNGGNLDAALYDVRENMSAIKRRTLCARIHSIQTRAVGYRLLGFRMRWLIWPAMVLLAKGFTPPHIAAFIRKVKAGRREKGNCET